MSQYQLRPVTQRDIRLIYDWANDPEVRKSAYQMEPISFQTHQVWFAKKLADTTCMQYILTDGSKDYGQIRGDVRDGVIEIDYSIAREYRGQGLAKVMIALFEEKTKDTPLYAEVKGENLASQRVFEALGYEKAEGEQIMVYRKGWEK